MSRYNYIDEELTVKGPVDVSQLPALGVTESTLVWKEGMKDWVPARTIPEIVDAIAGYAAQQASTLEPAQEPLMQQPEVVTQMPANEEQTPQSMEPQAPAAEEPQPVVAPPIPAPIVVPQEPVATSPDPIYVNANQPYNTQQNNQVAMNQPFPPQQPQPTYGCYNYTPQPPQKNGSNTVLIAIICVLVTAIIGGLLWFFLGRNTEKAEPVQEPRRDTVVIHEKETVIERQAPTQPVRVAPANPTTIKVTGTNVCLRLQPYIPGGADKFSNCLKYTNGTNVHPVKGTTLPYKGQEGDFYKTEYQGYTVYISTQFSSVY